MRGRYIALSVIGLAASLSAGIVVGRLELSFRSDAAEDGPKVLYWVAPMDPSYRRDGPGKSPMGMDLVPVYEGQEPAGDPSEVALSAVEINAIGVRTAVARVEPISERIDTVGFIRYDEHETSHIHTRVKGWIEELEIRAVGDPVARGDLLFAIYAPEITIGSFELLRGVRRGDASEIEVARGKLRNFGVTPDQIDEMAQADEPAQHLRVYAPQDGVVIALEAADGMYLEPGTRAMSLTDLSTVWLLVDIFERDIGRLSTENRAYARFEHLPGHVFEGEVDYIYPELDPQTRTLPVRLRFDNHDGLLRPNMYGTVSLVPNTTREAVTIPSEAVIRTGRTERVILKTGEGTFRPRLVTIGLRDRFGEGGRTEIVQGLAPGEEVVTSSQFLIDSESSLTAGFLRMAPTEAEPAWGVGELVALDGTRREVTLRHAPVAALDWPAMETRFTARADVALDRLSSGDEVKFAVVRGSDGLLALTHLRPDDGVAATGTGIVHAVTPDGKLTISHEPIPALGWPAMQMDMPVEGFDPSGVPIERTVSFDLAKAGDTFTIVAVRAEGTGGAETNPVTSGTAAGPPVTADGRIDAVDSEARIATITHGPIVEIGMPGMTMEFALAEALNPATLPLGADLSLTFERPDGMTMVLANVEPKAPPMRVIGRVNSVDPTARTANITHEPLVEIGMPGMTMDFPLAEALAPERLPVGRDVTLFLEKAPDFSLTLVDVEDGVTR